MAKKNRLQGRIRYEENYMDSGEHFIFELKYEDEEEWGMCKAFPLKDDIIHYTALTQIREWQDLGIEFWFHRA